MTTALATVCDFVENNPGGEWEHFQFDARFMRDAVGEVRKLQREVNRLQAARTASVELGESMMGIIDDLKANNDALFQDFLATRGVQDVLTTEINRLYAAEASRHAEVRAVNAVVTFSRDGSVTIDADAVEITGTVSA